MAFLLTEGDGKDHFQKWQIERISNFRDENTNDLYLQRRKTYLSLPINILHN
ncbi:hypothetical protein MTR_6g460460 [Medicago truncatula]|uniref:Uncharacterized protein n=1 Tax=Medicago truncatula TaxID=3880 RepID=A0A072U9H7_MEDTR|nr:hypothetical protein MTR_6g460460 [Medicago truncatula]